MKSKKAVVLLVLLAYLGAAWLLWQPWAVPRVNLRPSTAAGEVLAEEVGGLVSGGGKVLILSRQIPHPGPDATRERIAAFTAALQRHATLKLAGSEWVPRAPAGIMDLGAVTPEQILAALEKHPDANVLVVFAGLPPCSQTVVDALAARSVKLVAVCGYGPTARRWLESKALALAIVPRLEELPPTTRPPKTAREWFQREFQIITPESLSQLPY